MVLYVVFSNSVRTKYQTSICSKASLVIFVVNFFVFVTPFLVAYRTQGFWAKEGTYREQPEVSFRYDYFIMMETQNVDSAVICTSFSALTEAVEHLNKCSLIKVREEDRNLDGKNDVLHFDVEAIIGPLENVYSLTAILLFNYRLQSHSYLEMQSLGWIELSTAVGGARLDATADLKLAQKQLLKNSGKDFRFNTSIVTAQYVHDFDLYSILHEYSNRNVTTRLDNIYSVWSRLREPESPFVFHLDVNFLEETIHYKPGIYEVIKKAWVQYLALLYISYLIGRRIKSFILDNRLVHNIKKEPWKKLD